MTLHPQAKAVIDAQLAAGVPPTHSLSPAAAREAAVLRRTLARGQETPVKRVEDRTIPGPVGPMNVRIYASETAGSLPVLAFFHGGGWVVGDLDTHDDACRRLANRSGCLVVSVDYRLAPEHKFPAAADDAYASCVWLADQAGEIGGDGGRIAVGGISAGGNLAAAAALMSRDRGIPNLRFQILIVPVTDYWFGTVSYDENANGFMLTRDDMAYYWRHYLPDESSGQNPYASPLRAVDLAGLPPAFVATAEYDPLRDEGEAYGERLQQADGRSIVRRYPGMVHGFAGMASVINLGAVALDEASEALRAAMTRR